MYMTRYTYAYIMHTKILNQNNMWININIYYVKYYYKIRWNWITRCSRRILYSYTGWFSCNSYTIYFKWMNKYRNKCKTVWPVYFKWEPKRWVSYHKHNMQIIASIHSLVSLFTRKEEKKNNIKEYKIFLQTLYYTYLWRNQF